MKLKHILSFVLLATVLSIIACNNEEQNKAESQVEAKAPEWKEETVSYTGDNITMNGFIVYDANKEGTRPAVLVIPEWWGLTEYAKKRARELAALGYIAMAVDMYGNGITADNPDSAKKYATPFYSDPVMMQTRFDAALAKLKTYSQTDAGKVAAIGYCFGGTQVLNLARLGEDFKGVVSFHGNLLGVPLDKNKLKADILVCNGADDNYVSAGEIEKFKKEMDSTSSGYTFKSYPGAVHAFTNPEATALGEKFKMNIRYNAAADTASWNEMKVFFGKIFN